MLNTDLYGRGSCRPIKKKVLLEFCDDYDHPNDQIEYTVENILMDPPKSNNHSYEALTDIYNSVYSTFCKCQSTSCGPNGSTLCAHGANYIVHRSTNTNQCELVLNPSRRSKDLIYECSELCLCDPLVCTNRLVQYGPRKRLQIVNNSHLPVTNGDYKQMGLITTQAIPRGAFVCEYAGEILTRDEALTRHDERESKNYIICMNEHSMNEDDASNHHLQTFIDPRRKGNIGRYLNHSCDPNCEILSVRIDGPLPKLGKLYLNDCSKLKSNKSFVCRHFYET